MLLAKLLPREGNFFILFDQHAACIVRAVRAFTELTRHYDDPDARARYAAEVQDAEHAADRVAAEVHRLLHRTFVTPISREHIHGLIDSMDDICDLLQDATETLTLYDVRKLTDEVLCLGDISARCCDRVAHAVGLLPRLSRADVVEAAVKACEEIDQLESDADRVLREAMSRLFREEVDVRELIKLKAIYEQLEAITDRCEDVANMIEGVVLENA